MMTSSPSPSSADPNSADEWLPVGQLVGAQGLRGELRLNPASDFPERCTEPGPRWLQAKGSAPKEVELLEGRQDPLGDPCLLMSLIFFGGLRLIPQLHLWDRECKELHRSNQNACYRAAVGHTPHLSIAPIVLGKHTS